MSWVAAVEQVLSLARVFSHVAGAAKKKKKKKKKKVRRSRKYHIIRNNKNVRDQNSSCGTTGEGLGAVSAEARV